MTDFERRVHFIPGHNHLHHPEPDRRSQQGMTAVFGLVGPEGAVTFEFNTHWTPPGEGQDDGEITHCDYTYSRDEESFGLIRPPEASAVVIHWRANIGSALGSQEGCGWLDGDTCWSDATSSDVGPIIRTFIKEGVGPVWSALEGWYEATQQRALLHRQDVSS